MKRVHGAAIHSFSDPVRTGVMPTRTSEMFPVIPVAMVTLCAIKHAFPPNDGKGHHHSSYQHLVDKMSGFCGLSLLHLLPSVFLGTTGLSFTSSGSPLWIQSQPTSAALQGRLSLARKEGVTLRRQLTCLTASNDSEAWICSLSSQRLNKYKTCLQMPLLKNIHWSIIDQRNNGSGAKHLQVFKTFHVKCTEND